MNMRIHINKKLAEICFLILLLLCMYAEAQRDTKFVHQETQENQRRVMAQTETMDTHTSEDRGSIATSGPAIETQTAANETGPAEGKDANTEGAGVKKDRHMSFWSGVIDSLSMIFFVEFGDRTFMITVLFTMKHDKCKVFFPAIVTMMGMHVISVGFGTLFPLLFSRNAIVYFSVFLFLFFGVMMIYEAYHLEPKTAEEKVEELQKDLLSSKDPEAEAVNEKKHSEESIENYREMTPYPLTASGGSTVPSPKKAQPETQLAMEKGEEGSQAKQFCTNPYLHLVVLLFLADWGDRCQISAIVLTATHNAWGVAVGGALGMAVCVFLAVLAGAFLANKLDEKKTTYIAGALFIVFAFQSLFMVE